MIQANSLHIPLKDESVQCVVTSPAYWGLRDYGTATWEGGKKGCDHKVKSARNDAGRVNTDGFHGSSDGDKGDINYSEVCGKCGHKETVPCIVLDNFGGSGTTKNVAERLGRLGVMLELKMEYIEMAKKRCYQLPGLF